MDLPKHIKGVIFDLDGTLLDSMWIWADIDRRFLTKRGIAVPPDYMHAVGAMDFRGAAEYTIKRFGLSDTPEELMTEWSEMAVAAYSYELRLKPKVNQLLIEYKARGLKLAVATSATPDMCIPALKNNDVLNLLDAVITTWEIGKGKAFPDVYLEAVRRLTLQPETCAVFEDALRAVKTAKAAGFYTVGVSDEYSKSDEQEIKRVADGFVVL